MSCRCQIQTNYQAIIVAIYFIYVGNIISAAPYVKLQSTIIEILDTVENDVDIRDWLFIPTRDRAL